MHGKRRRIYYKNGEIVIFGKENVYTEKNVFCILIIDEYNDCMKHYESIEIAIKKSKERIDELYKEIQC